MDHRRRQTITLGSTGTSGYKDFNGASVSPTPSSICPLCKGGAATAAAVAATRLKGASTYLNKDMKTLQTILVFRQQIEGLKVPRKVDRYLACRVCSEAGEPAAVQKALYDVDICSEYPASLPPAAAGPSPSLNTLVKTDFYCLHPECVYLMMTVNLSETLQLYFHKRRMSATVILDDTTTGHKDWPRWSSFPNLRSCPLLPADCRCNPPSRRCKVPHTVLKAQKSTLQEDLHLL